VAEQVKISPRQGDTEDRCPYCHDLLAAEDDPRVECEGCGTQHHLACLTELGRCTVMGCDRPIDAGALASLPPATSRVQRVIRQRQRERARQFVRRHAHAPQTSPGQARRASREGGWREKPGWLGANRPRYSPSPMVQDRFARNLALAFLGLLGFVVLLAILLSLLNPA
jgi:hypothetical protein